MEMGIVYRVENSTVYALKEGERIGQVVVEDIDLHWAEGVYVKVGGIAGVQTKEEFRRRGIASQMMREAKMFAAERGYSVSAVSTNMGNVARRLYSKSGYVTVFKPGRFERRLGKREPFIAPVRIRHFREGDEHEMIAIFESLFRSFFGWRRKSPERWMKLRSPDSIFVAEDDEGIQGWSACFRQWVGLVCELHVRRSEKMRSIAKALLYSLEEHLLSIGEKEAHFWLSPVDEFSAELLLSEGYRFTEQRVFKVCILDLRKLLDALTPLFNMRVERAPRWEGVIQLRTPTCQASLRVKGDVSVEEGGKADVALFMPQDVLVRMLCGVVDTKEAFLEGVLSVEPKMDETMMAVLNSLFPKVPWHHPADDLW